MKRALYLLAELSDRDFNWWVTVGKRKQISVGTVLIQEGQPIDALYLVLDGMLSVTAEVLDGKEIATLSSGEIVGKCPLWMRVPLGDRYSGGKHRRLAHSLIAVSIKIVARYCFAAHFYHAIAAFLSDRVRGTVSRLGYSRYPQLNQETESANNLNPEISATLELAKVRLDWLLNRLKDT